MADQQKTAAAPSPRKFPSQWAAQKKPEAWQFAAASAAGRWEPEFPALTEDEFDAAIKAASEIRIG